MKRVRGVPLGVFVYVVIDTTTIIPFPRGMRRKGLVRKTSSINYYRILRSVWSDLRSSLYEDDRVKKITVSNQLNVIQDQ